MITLCHTDITCDASHISYTEGEFVEHPFEGAQ